jgi:hypothetical protein
MASAIASLGQPIWKTGAIEIGDRTPGIASTGGTTLRPASGRTAQVCLAKIKHNTHFSNNLRTTIRPWKARCGPDPPGPEKSCCSTEASKRLETNTGMRHMNDLTSEGATPEVPASRVYGSPSDGFWLAFPFFTDSPVTRGCLAPPAMRLIARTAPGAAAWPSRTIESLLFDLV